MAMEKVPMDGMPAPGEEVCESQLIEDAFTYRDLVYKRKGNGYWVCAFETKTMPDWFYILREINGLPVTKIDLWFLLIGFKSSHKDLPIKGIYIPDSVSDIGDLSMLSNSTQITVAPKNQAISLINGNLCSKDGKILLAGIGKENENFVVPDGICELGAHALENGRYPGVIIPLSVKKIGPENTKTLSECALPKVLTTDQFGNNIFYKGTKKEWKKISISYNIKSEIKQGERKLYFYSEKPKKGTWHFAPDGVTPVITQK